MKKILGTNAVIEENRQICGRTTYFRLILAFLLVELIGSILTEFIALFPSVTYYLTQPSVLNFMTSGGADSFALAALLTSLKLPDWLIAITLASRVGMILAVVFYCRKFEKRRAFGLGMGKEHAVSEYLIGFLVGILIFSASVGISVISGEVSITGFNSSVSAFGLIMLLVGYMIQGASEEILMRSFFLVTASRCAGGVPVAVVLNSLVFAILHLGNNGINALAFLNLTLFGVFASVYFIRRGNIWGISAVHTAWNFVQGNVFGLSVSGNASGSSLLTSDFAGGLFSGGDFGPESGLSVTIVLVLGIAFLLLTKKRAVTPPPFAIKSRFYTAHM